MIKYIYIVYALSLQHRIHLLHTARAVHLAFIWLTIESTVSWVGLQFYAIKYCFKVQRSALSYAFYFLSRRFWSIFVVRLHQTSTLFSSNEINISNATHLVLSRLQWNSDFPKFSIEYFYMTITQMISYRFYSSHIFIIKFYSIMIILLFDCCVHLSSFQMIHKNFVIQGTNLIEVRLLNCQPWIILYGYIKWKTKRRIESINFCYLNNICTQVFSGQIT